MTSRMTPLLERNEQFARTYAAAPLALPAAQVILITCLDHRVDPALTLGLRLGDAPGLRNAGGPVDGDKSVEVAVIHHTQCGTGLLADPGFRREASEATGADEAALEASAVADPHITVAADVERLLASPLLPPQMSVSGHVYDVETGRVTTVLDARHPQPAGTS